MPERDNTPVTDTPTADPAATAVAAVARRREPAATLDGDTIVIPTHVAGLPLRFTRDQQQLNPEQMRMLAPLGIDADYDIGEVIAFLMDCRKRGFDPYAKEAMLYRIAGKYIRHVGIEGLRRKAEETREYRGQAPPMFCGPDGVWKDVWTGDEPPLAAKVGVYRAGFVEAVSRPVFWDEYCPTQEEKRQLGRNQWEKTGRRVPIANWRPASQGGKPLVMLIKCAEAAALRAAWPNTFSGYYVPEETAKMRADADQHTAAAKEAEAQRDAAAERRHAAYTKANPPAARERVIDGTAIDTTPADDQRGELARAEICWQAETLGRDVEWITRRWRAARAGQDFTTATTQEVVELALRYRPVVAEALRKAGQTQQADRYAATGDRIAPLTELLAEQ
jgi:hypothetical protein